MQIVNITQRKFNTLKKLELPSNVFSREADLYVISGKDKWDKKETLLKKLHIGTGEVFSNKLYTINELLNKKEEIGIDELIMPEALAAIDNEVVGFTMPYIPSINFQELLDSKEFTITQKMAYLKEIGELLEKLHKVREYTNIKGFYLNDIHENNFILNKKTGKINVVDLDSCKIGNNLTEAARYLTSIGSQLQYITKYSPLNYSVGGIYEISENTEIYCYIIMIFNFLYGSNIGKMSITEFYVYLDYLIDIGVSKEFVDKISYIYTGKNNENPYKYLDELPRFLDKTQKSVFERVRKKGI